MLGWHRHWQGHVWCWVASWGSGEAQAQAAAPYAIRLVLKPEKLQPATQPESVHAAGDVAISSRAGWSPHACVAGQPRLSSLPHQVHQVTGLKHASESGAGEHVLAALLHTPEQIPGGCRCHRRRGQRRRLPRRPGTPPPRSAALHTASMPARQQPAASCTLGLICSSKKEGGKGMVLSPAIRLGAAGLLAACLLPGVRRCMLSHMEQQCRALDTCLQRPKEAWRGATCAAKGSAHQHGFCCLRGLLMGLSNDDALACRQPVGRS